MATKCKLQVRCASVALDVAWGQTYPSGVGALLHGVNIELGFSKVNVDGVYANFEVVLLEMPQNDEVMTLGQAIGSFIQWPKSNICLELPTPVSTTSQEVSALELPAPVSTSQDVPATKLPAPELPAPMRQGPGASDASTPHARSTPVKSTSKK